MKKRKTLLFVFLCIVAFIGCYLVGAKLAMARFSANKYKSMRVKWDASVGTVYKDLSYGEKESNRYDLYLPAETRDSYALILHIHGGGFYGGDKKEGEILCKYYASKGFVTASVNYSLMTPGSDSNVNVMCEEVLTALRQIQAVCQEKGYQITEMATTGESAGATLALLTGLRNGDKTPVPVRFIMVESGPASFIPELWDPDSDVEKRIEFVNNMTGESFTAEDFDTEAYHQAIDAISPASYINEDTLPLLLAYGAYDMAVPPNIKEPMMSALEKYHPVYDYILFPNSGHSLYNDPDKLAEYRAKMDEYTVKYFGWN